MVLAASFFFAGLAGPKFTLLANDGAVATCISPDGLRVCGGTPSGGGTVPIAWSSSGAEVFRWRPPTKQAAMYWRATGISNGGSLIAGLGESHDDKNAPHDDGFVANASGKWTTIAPMTATTDVTWMRAVAADGSFAVGFTSNAKVGYAIRVSPTGAVTKLASLTGSNDAEARAVSLDRTAIVGYCGDKKKCQSVLWRNGKPTNLGDLPGGETYGQAWATNRDGSVVVGWGEDRTGRKPVRWTRTTGMVALGSIPVGFEYGMARGVSADGNVVVGIWTKKGGGRSQGFVWRKGAGMRTVEEEFARLGASAQISGWHIANVIGISADGHTIAGGCHNGKVWRAFVARLP